MPSTDGWYLAGPLLAFGMVGALVGTMRWCFERDVNPLGEPSADSLDSLREDYGLLSPAALTEDRRLANDVRRTLAEAGIRSTCAVRSDGYVVVLVFAEEVDEARRLAGGPSERQ
jgi:hypothetical protein